MSANIPPLEAVTFEMPGNDPKRPVWQVCLQEDGSLYINPIGRSPTRILVMPSSHMSIHVTTERIVQGSKRIAATPAEGKAAL